MGDSCNISEKDGRLIATHFFTNSTTRHRRYRKWPQPQAGLSVEPRAFEVDTLPSTPQLNAIMDRAMGKVKSMVNELEDEKGKIVSKIYKV